MTALVKASRGADHTSLADVPVPEPGPGEVRVHVLAAGICGTDLHILDDEFPAIPPVVMGHEVTGVVDAVGNGVNTALTGQRVALETYAYTCGVCEYCRSGRQNLCRTRRSIGSHVNGGFATFLVVPAVNAHLVHPDVSMVAGALYEPLACVAHCLCDPAVASPGDTALVVGPGTVGLLAAQVLKAQGAAVTVVGTSRDERRLAKARELGLLAQLGSDEADEFDVAVDCSGSAGGIASAMQHLRPGGQYVQIGLCGRPIQVDVDALILHETPMRTGFASTPRSWARAERLVAGGHVQLDPLVTDVLPLKDWQSAFERTRAGDGVKFVLEPGGEGEG